MRRFVRSSPNMAMGWASAGRLPTHVDARGSREGVRAPRPAPGSGGAGAGGPRVASGGTCPSFASPPLRPLQFPEWKPAARSFRSVVCGWRPSLVVSALAERGGKAIPPPSTLFPRARSPSPRSFGVRGGRPGRRAPASPAASLTSFALLEGPGPPSFALG